MEKNFCFAQAKPCPHLDTRDPGMAGAFSLSEGSMAYETGKLAPNSPSGLAEITYQEDKGHQGDNRGTSLLAYTWDMVMPVVTNLTNGSSHIQVLHACGAPMKPCN